MTTTNRPALSLIELLVVIAIIAILIGLILPTNRRVHGATYRTMCTNNLKQLIIALQSYHDTHHRFPPGYHDTPTVSPNDRLSWMVELLPYLEQDNLYKTFDRSQGYSRNVPAAQTHVRLFHCPSPAITLSPDMTSYMAMAGVLPNAAELPAKADGIGFMGYQRATTFADITDGTGNTIAIMESAQPGTWAIGGPGTVRDFLPTVTPLHGPDAPFGGTHLNKKTFGGRDYVGTNVAMADGSVRYLSPKATDPQLFAAWVTIAGGESHADWE